MTYSIDPCDQCEELLQPLSMRAVDAGLAYADGTALAAGQVPQVLGVETPVVISGDGAAVHPFFLRLVRPRTVVVAIPPPVPDATRICTAEYWPGNTAIVPVCGSPSPIRRALGAL